MVCRLVKEKDVRFLQKDFCKLDTHPPSSGELIGRTVEILAGETKSRQCPLYLSLVIISSKHHKPLMFLRKFLYQLHVRVALVVGTLCQLAVHDVYLLLQCGHLCKCLACLFPYRSVVLQYHYLRQVAYGLVVRYCNVTCSRGLLTAQYLQHGRFPCAVFSYEGNAVTVINHETCVQE